MGRVFFRLRHQRLWRVTDSAVCIVDSHGRRGHFNFSVRFWDPIDVRRLVLLLGGTDPEIPPTDSRREFEREFPGAFNVWERHPYVLGVLLTIVLLAGLVVFVRWKG